MTLDRPDNRPPSAADSSSTGGAADLAGFSQCQSPSEVWQRFYHGEWEEVNAKYFDPAALQNFGQYEHKYDANICTPDDLDLALKHMAESLHNPWTKYTTAAEQAAKDSQAGLGQAAAGYELASAGPGKFKIEFIHFGSPAQSSDLREGDIVTAINGKDLSTLTLAQAKALQIGQSGDHMEVQAEHGGVGEKVDLTLAPTPQEKIDARMVNQEVAYVRLPDFKSEARVAEFIQTIDGLMKKTPGGLKGLVLDLRNDPGGDLPVAQTIASLFLPDDKMIVAKQYVRSLDPADGGALKEKDLPVIPAGGITVKGKQVDEKLVQELRHLPMTVLVNGSSASAAEVLTGALKDNGRATIVGSHSFGKGVGYKTDHLPDGGTLSITQLKYLTPSGYDLNGRGISPDIAVEARPGDHDDRQLEAALNVLMTTKH
jgi:carboxyl-terminal processing protease